MAWSRARIPIPEDLTPAEREELGERILDFIRDRTERGIGVKPRGDGWVNVTFPPYSDSYINSPAFKAAGKSANKVNLKLSGDMMAAMDLLSHSPGSILIGYKNGTENNDKAEGNADRGRDHLGISKSDLNMLINQVRSK
jgi:hypothetical protein